MVSATIKYESAMHCKILRRNLSVLLVLELFTSFSPSFLKSTMAMFLKLAISKIRLIFYSSREDTPSMSNANSFLNISCKFFAVSITLLLEEAILLLSPT